MILKCASLLNIYIIISNMENNNIIPKHLILPRKSVAPGVIMLCMAVLGVSKS